MQVEVGVRAVLFDYGRTLVTFDYPAQELAGVRDVAHLPFALSQAEL